MARASALRVARVLRRLNRLIPAASRSSRGLWCCGGARCRCGTTLSSGEFAARGRPGDGAVSIRSKRANAIMRQSFESPNCAFGDALEGGTEVGSRVRTAAAACLVACGLFVGGTGAALAFAVPALVSGGPGEARRHRYRSRAERRKRIRAPTPIPARRSPPKAASRAGKPGGQKPAMQKPDDGRPGDHKPDDSEARSTRSYPPARTPIPGDPTPNSRPGGRRRG